jgi:mRNA interferase MazF
MPITFTPDLGQVLMCDFSSPAFIRPEMEKIRHCIVISPRYRRHTGTCVVVPVSTSKPDRIEPYHYQIPNGVYRCFHDEQELWVKGDMLTHASFARLDRPYQDGRRARVVLNLGHLQGTQKAVLAAIGLPKLCDFLEIQVLTKTVTSTIITSVPDKSGL